MSIRKPLHLIQPTAIQRQRAAMLATTKDQPSIHKIKPLIPNLAGRTSMQIKMT